MPEQSHLPDVWAQARALRDRGDLASARMLLEDSLDSATFQYGEDHPDILATAHLLATLHRRAADLPTARRVLEEALQAGALRHDEGEPVMLKLSFELAGVADQLGNKHEARKHYTRVAVHGAGRPEVADQVREATAWLGPQAPAAQPQSPAPGVLALPPAQEGGLPQRVPQSRPVMGPTGLPQATAPAAQSQSPAPHGAPHPPAGLPLPSAGGPPAAGAPAGVTPVPQPGSAAVVAEAAPAAHPVPQQHAPLPALAGPVRYPTSQHPQVHVEEARPAPIPLPVAAPSPVFTSAPAVIVEKRGRGVMAAAVAAALVAVVAAGVVVFLLLGRGQNPTDPAVPGPQQGQQTAKRGPATGLQLSDRGDAITLRWQDPADGVAGFAVKMGPSRDDLKLVTGNLGAKATFTITGLNAKFTYCFSVVTIYSGTEVYDSDPICTTRSSSKTS